MRNKCNNSSFSFTFTVSDNWCRFYLSGHSHREV